MMQKPKVYDDYLVNRRQVVSTKGIHFLVDNLNFRLLFVTHILVGPIEAAAVFILYFKYMAHQGFLPKTLCDLNYKWYDPSADDIIDSYGQEWVNFTETTSSRVKIQIFFGFFVLFFFAEPCHSYAAGQ